MERTEKRCSKCKQVLPLERFSKRKDSPDGRVYKCKDCVSEGRSTKRVQPRTDEEIHSDILDGSKVCRTCGERKSMKEYFKQHKSVDLHAHHCKQCVSGATDKTWRRKSHYKLKYNITIADYDRLVTEQDGKCVICKKAGRLVVDHNHRTGEVRGLLCPSCNTLLGLAQDSATHLWEAMRYLDERGSYGNVKKEVIMCRV